MPQNLLRYQVVAERRKGMNRFVKGLLSAVLIYTAMTLLAWLFAQLFLAAWDQEEFRQQSIKAQRYEQLQQQINKGE